MAAQAHSCLFLNYNKRNLNTDLNSATLDDDIYDFIPLDSVQIFHTDNGYVNSGSFENWFKTIFLPELHRLKEQYNYHDKTFVIMDGLKAHENLLVNIDSEAEHIVFHFLVPHFIDTTIRYRHVCNNEEI